MALLLATTLLLGGNRVRANNVGESEIFCRYLFSEYESSNALHGIWTEFWDKASDATELAGELIDADLGFYDKNKMKQGYLANTLFDVIDNQESITIKQTRSSSLYADFVDKINHKDFYNNGSYFCPKEIYGKKPTQDRNTGRYIITLYSSKKNFYNEVIYIYYLFQGPMTRDAAAGTVEISNATCLGLLGSFKNDLDGILKIIRLVAPLMVIIYSTYDFLGAIFSSDAELLKKASSRLQARLILIAILFFLPTILNIILGIIDTSYTTCV
ncbi:MAG: hypothetical protein LBJ11_00500 [Oscillospiraceae bacterium]|jgi:hypothetical protein|nr:hypothetical protein [Oscillospiraceae bacterium]